MPTYNSHFSRALQFAYNQPSVIAYSIAMLSLLAVLFFAINHLRFYREETSYGQRLGCEPPPELSYTWPLGIDRIKQLWDSNAEGHLLEFLCSVAKGYEPRNMLSQYLLVGPRAYHILRPENLEAVLSTNFRDYGFGARPSVFAPLIGKGIFTQEGAAWKHSRELLRKQFMRAQYQKLDEFSEHVDNLIANLPKDGEVDLQALFFKLTLDTATSLLFGKSVYSLRAGVDQDTRNKEFADSFNIAQEGLAKRFRLAPWHSLYSPVSFRKACADVHRFVEDYIDSQYASNEVGGGTSSHFFFNEVAQGSASKQDIRDQLLNVLLAGRDTTACCLSWTFRLLVRHVNTFQRLRDEIDSVMGNTQSPSREDIRRMPFLACVIKESLRLYPPVPLNNRTAIRTTVLPTGGGATGNSPILVRKGELVVFSQYVNSRKKNIYGEDATEFRPERWESGELDEVGYAYFPFNRGPRQCLGEDFALMEASYTIVRLVKTFRTIELPDKDPIKPVGSEKQLLTLVLSCAEGCRVRLGSANPQG